MAIEQRLRIASVEAFWGRGTTYGVKLNSTVGL
jgi:hypothetical protein